MEQIKSAWGKVVKHVVENKELYIRAGLTIVGSAIGAAAAVVILNAANENYLVEEVLMSVEGPSNELV